MQIMREYHGILLHLIEDYLVELGGTMIGEDQTHWAGANYNLLCLINRT